MDPDEDVVAVWLLLALCHLLRSRGGRGGATMHPMWGLNWPILAKTGYWYLITNTGILYGRLLYSVFAGLVNVARLEANYPAGTELKIVVLCCCYLVF